MTEKHHSWLLLAAVPTVLALCARASADPIHEANNTPATAFVLPAGQMSVSDDLNGAEGRPDLILGHFTGAFGVPLSIAGSLPDKPYITQMLDVPLDEDGAAFFGITGAPDSNFQKAHNQSGNYVWTAKVYDSNHELVKTQTASSDVAPFETDYEWIDADDSLATWANYTVDVVVNAAVGPGTGDSLDFFQFTGLTPFQSFTAVLTDYNFNAKIGWFNASNTLIALGQDVDGMLTLSGVADASGNVKIGITGLDDLPFNGSHGEIGIYTLTIVPEPGSVVLLAVGMALVALFWKRTRRPAAP